MSLKLVKLKMHSKNQMPHKRLHKHYRKIRGIKLLPFLWIMIRSSGFALKRARRRFSSLFIGSKSWSLGSMYDIRNGVSFKRCNFSSKARNSSNLACLSFSRENLRNSASNWKISCSHYNRVNCCN